MNKVKKSKYLNAEESKQFFTQVELVQKETMNELEKVQQKYQVVASNEKMGNKHKLKKLNRLATKEKKLNIKIQRLEVDKENLEKGTYIKRNWFEKMMHRLKTLSYAEQKMLTGILFILPWLIGFILFFARPLLTTIVWSFSDVKTDIGGLTVNFNGIENFKYLFTQQTLQTKTFLEVLTVSIQSTLYIVPVVFIFSLIIAVMLNTKFKGHQFFKAIFFIPVIYNATIISTALSGDFGNHLSSSTEAMSTLLPSFVSYLKQVGLGEEVIDFALNALNEVFNIVNKSGIQILIFIAALQSIPPHLYEAAKVEGATTYECFWKVTFPMVSNIFLPILVYTIVDCFGSSLLMNIVTKDSSVVKIPYGIQSAIALIYFSVNLLIIGIIFIILRKAVHKYE